MADVEKRDFHFNEHIFPVTEEMVRRQLASQWGWRARTLFSGGEEKLEEKVNEEAERLNIGFDHRRRFFGWTEALDYCDLAYQVTRHEDPFADIHEVVITANRSQFLDIAGHPSYPKAWDGARNMHLPVKKHADEFDLVIYANPQVDIPVYGEVEVMYKFSTRFDLGSLPGRFTGNVMKRSRQRGGILDEPDPPVDLFYGEPGKLYRRSGDALDKGLDEAVFNNPASKTRGLSVRSRFHMDGAIYVRNGPQIYRGPFESTGFFPFFITPNPKEGNAGTAAPRPHTLVGA